MCPEHSTVVLAPPGTLGTASTAWMRMNAGRAMEDAASVPGWNASTPVVVIIVDLVPLDIQGTGGPVATLVLVIYPMEGVIHFPLASSRLAW